MSNETILVVEDDENIVELLRVNLVRAGYKLLSALSGEEGIQAIRTNSPDLVLLDLMLPGITGLDVCRLAKADLETRDIPVIIVTARGEESDIVAGLELGADDYVTKPFSPRVLLARVRTVLRRNAALATSEKDTVTRVHNLTIHPGRHQVFVDDQPIDLTPTEFGLLGILARRPGWVMTRNHIIEGLHGAGYPVTDRAVDVQVVGLRKKLGAAGRLIGTVRGIGYRMQDPSEEG